MSLTYLDIADLAQAPDIEVAELATSGDGLQGLDLPCATPEADSKQRFATLCVVASYGGTDVSLAP